MLDTCLEDPGAPTRATSPSPSWTGSEPDSASGYRTAHAFSRPGRELIRLPGLASLREIQYWPVVAAALDGEAVDGDRSEGIQAVFHARNRPGSRMAFTAFDLLELDGQSVMGEAWTVRRKRAGGSARAGRSASASSPRSGSRSTAPWSARRPGSSSNQSSRWRCS